MIDEKTKADLIKAADNYKVLFPHAEISYPEMLKRFNNSSYANPNNYLAPIYEENSYKDFILFAKEEIEREKASAKSWTPSKETVQSQNAVRRNQMKNKSMFSLEK